MIPDSLKPVISQAQEETDHYGVSYSAFNESGTYRIVLVASDEDALTSRPLEVTLEVQATHQLYLPTIIR